MYQNLMPQGNSQVTLELRQFIEAGNVLFDPDDKYPIWNEEHREELEKKIIEHYYMRQIGFETFGAFKYHVNVRMREIMPYYVELYKTTQFKYNPLENYNMTEGSEEKTTSDSSSTGTGLEKFSDTPQGKIENLEKYLTNATKNENEATSKSADETSHTAWRKGNIGVTSSQSLVKQERDLIINIDLMIIDELKDLFLGVY